MVGRSGSVTKVLNDAPLSLFHFRTVLTAGMGFFTDAYDLFIISAALGVAGTLRITFLFAMVAKFVVRQS